MERGRQVRGDTLLILLNAHHEEVPFALPPIADGTAWMRLMDTIAAHVDEQRYDGGAKYPLQGQTMALFLLRSEQRRRASDQGRRRELTALARR
jgi:isoamylase